MRDKLVGYLLKALEPSEHEQVDILVKQDEQLKRELDALNDSIKPLRSDIGHFDPPPGLVEQTLARVESHRPVPRSRQTADHVAEADKGFFPPRRRWSLIELAVAIGIGFAMVSLTLPAINHSRFNARLVACKDNLGTMATGFVRYRERHHGLFPKIPQHGNTAVAGIFAPQLIEEKCLYDLTGNPSRIFVCPDSGLAAEAAGFRVPSTEDLIKARGEQLAQLQKRVSGSYGYSLGHVILLNGKPVYRDTKCKGRPYFAIVSDAPCRKRCFQQTSNHGGRGQNVLFEDGHIKFMTSCRRKKCIDKDFFHNDNEKIAPGIHPDDAVVVAGYTRLVVAPVSVDSR